MCRASGMKRMRQLLLIGVACCVASCGSGRMCRTEGPPGSMGSVINSAADDMSPHIVRGALLFSSNRSLTDLQQEMLHTDLPEAVFRSERRADGSFAPADVDVELALNVNKAGTPAVLLTEDSQGLIVFPRAIGSAKEAQVDLFETVLRNGQWTPAAVISELESKYWDSQPALSADGQILVFSSDRPGGFGGTDLWYSLRTEGGWSAARNLGKEINSAADEQSPFLDHKSDLYFASNRTQGPNQRGFEIMRATHVDQTSWAGVEYLPSPINSEADDISPAVSGDTIYFASRRSGGCGGYDLYAMQLCGPVWVRGEVQSSSTLSRRSGIITVLDSVDRIAPIPVPEDGHFEFKVWPNRRYILRYLNECSDSTLEQEFSTPCNESKVVVLQTKLKLPEQKPVFNLHEYDVPFFSKGYYLPSTTQELNDLRLKFAYNFLGVEESTKYIVQPGKEYNDYALKVDSAFDRMRDFILGVLEYRKRGCTTSPEAFKLKVEAFADSKGYASTAVYNGPDISDDKLELQVKAGTPMTKGLMASLRAYYVIKVLELRLSSNPLYQEYKNRLKWRIAPREDEKSADPESLIRMVDVGVE